ncbi:hypothetical protein Taro_049075 [Colocasia esculenta]|uniref:non-specific serine/threonine protein kinase n=1 Tax=Colocasia esculenta TaxID=4460 RepID=A0A843X9W5_COLES|nr:hypothetical protein [Colocasia esculenta]
MESHTGWPLLLTILSALLSLSAAKDTIAPGDLFGDADSLISADGRFKLGFFTPAGKSESRYLGIWYATIPVQTVVWVANRDRPLPNSTGVFSISGNGSFVLSDANGAVYWSTGAATGLASPVARLLNTSNFVVIGASGEEYAWQTFDQPTDSLLPGMKAGWDPRSGRNRNLTSWRSWDDPAPGDYTLAMDLRGDPQPFLMRGTTRVWRIGPWIGGRFTGIPEMTTYENLFKFSFSRSTDEAAFWYDIGNRSMLSRAVLHPNGVYERVVWNENTQTWNRYWFAPKDQCDTMSTCGPFGICDTSYSPVCRCMQGFVPRSPQNWNMRDGSDGCVRRTPLDCRNGTDGIVRVAGVKLPDTSLAVVKYAMGLEECGSACLGNCSCTAYSYGNVAGGGGGCILWVGDLTDVRVNPSGGDDLFVRLADSDLASSSTPARRRRVTGIMVAAVVFGLFVLGWIGWCLWRRNMSSGNTSSLSLARARALCFYLDFEGKLHLAVVWGATICMNSHRNEEMVSKGNEELELPLFNFATIAAATAAFSNENKLGEGGFGPVFKGRLGNGQEVAVKCLARNSVQGLEEFKNEVLLIAKLQHRNLVRLLGCCIKREERMLVYEYMPNKSLDAFLFDKTKGSLLAWNTRYQIIRGIARGLLYLHQDSRLRIIHRDLKASNVLLDKEMNPKISDFGMARMFSGDQMESKTRRVVGTYGYMSPEYIMHGLFSVKSDVFSFGVVVLEIVSGKRNRGIYLSDPNLNLLGKLHLAVVSGATISMNSHRNEEMEMVSRGNEELELPLFNFATIAAATAAFSNENKLGEGGFGPVVKGRLGNGQEVAVKRLARNSVQGLEEFKNEVLLIAKLQHRNLVRLLGCCIEREERILVYEYMHNKSLDAFLFDKTKGSLLAWNTRYQIIKGIARGLLYLHQDSRLRIIHRDLKASNVLLDMEMNPKISDFGMARMFSGDQTEANTRRVVGTYGYMSPEYIMHGLFSVKSDVFSFGVVVLEIVSGKRNRGIYLSDPNLNLLGYTWNLWKAGNWVEMVDPSMLNCFPQLEVLKCINSPSSGLEEEASDHHWHSSEAALPPSRLPF